MGFADSTPLAENYAITLSQLAISWTISRPGITHALVGARNINQARENASAVAVSLHPDDLQMLEKILIRHGMAGN